jgi:hypothetical protein
MKEYDLSVYIDYVFHASMDEHEHIISIINKY